MRDRGMLKWTPFDSVTSSKMQLQKLLKERQKVPMPILSEEQITTITETIYQAYQLGETVKIQYYKDGYYYLKEGKIIHINPQAKLIILTNNFPIYLRQIIKIYN